jgi:hypothetical protein
MLNEVDGQCYCDFRHAIIPYNASTFFVDTYNIDYPSEFQGKTGPCAKLFSFTVAGSVKTAIANSLQCQVVSQDLDDAVSNTNNTFFVSDKKNRIVVTGWDD